MGLRSFLEQRDAAWAFVFFAACGAASCQGGSREQTPERAFDEFVGAIERADAETVFGHLSRATRVRAAAVAGVNPDDPGAAAKALSPERIRMRWEIRDRKVLPGGTSHRVTIEVAGLTPVAGLVKERVPLVWEEGAWRIDLPDLPRDGGAPPTEVAPSPAPAAPPVAAPPATRASPPAGPPASAAAAPTPPPAGR